MQQLLLDQVRGADDTAPGGGGLLAALAAARRLLRGGGPADNSALGSGSAGAGDDGGVGGSSGAGDGADGDAAGSDSARIVRARRYAFPVSAADVAIMLQVLGVDRIITVDMRLPGQGQSEVRDV